MAAQNPKKQPKSKKLNLNTKSQWKNILKEVEKREVPIHVLEKLIVALKDGTQVVVDIKRLLAEGNDPDELELSIKQKLKALDNIITDIDFFISVTAVQKVVQPATDEILKNL